MSKHNRNRGFQRQNINPTAVTPNDETTQTQSVPAAEEPKPTTDSVEDLLNAATGEDVATEVAPTEEVIPAPEQEKTPEVTAPINEPVNVVKEEPPPAPVVVPSTPKKAEKVTAEDIYPSVSPIMKKLVNIKPRERTPAGIRLAALFDEYNKMVATPTKDKKELINRAMKLHQVMSVGCPVSLRDAIVAQDLVRVAFDKLMENWGTLYNDSTLFQLDYTLPAGAAAIDKLNMYWGAMIQLVEAAKYRKRIMFDDSRLALVLKSPIISSAITKMKNGIIERNRNLPPAE